MFSANENIRLRQEKKRIVDKVESCIPEPVLDLGVNVMVMQVACKAPGCVPLETAIIIVFPSSQSELLPGLPESAGGSFKTKILKPMAQVTEQDILEALPPQFQGGLRSLERVALNARDVMLAQVEQLFDNRPNDKRALAQYLQQALQDYIDRGCHPPEYGQPFAPLPNPIQSDTVPIVTVTTATPTNDEPPTSQQESQAKSSPGTIVLIQQPESDDAATRGGTAKNIVLKRPNVNQHGTLSTTNNNNNNNNNNSNSSNNKPLPPQPKTAPISKSPLETTRHLQHHRALEATAGSSDGTLRTLMERQEHAASGILIRRPGCPCCDPDHPNNVVDRMMMMMHF